ncbi:hypothetical protein [Nocardia sp. NPDC051833]|uniref:hypothetical protein n=1 Tax=Nocardia sp. NPDC051833 TaxID=3155674 RepID=UPI003438275A
MVVAVAVPALAWGVVTYRSGHAPKGTPASGQTPPAVCELPESVLAQTRTHNFREFELFDAAPDRNAPDLDFSCDWDQLAGADGIDSRAIGWRAYRFDSADRALRYFEMHREMPSVLPPFEIRSVDGFPGPASCQRTVDKSGTTEVALTVLDRNRIVVVRIDAEDQHFLWTRPTPFTTAEALTALVAREVLQRTW